LVFWFNIQQISFLKYSILKKHRFVVPGFACSNIKILLQQLKYNYIFALPFGNKRLSKLVSNGIKKPFWGWGFVILRNFLANLEQSVFAFSRTSKQSMFPVKKKKKKKIVRYHTILIQTRNDSENQSAMMMTILNSLLYHTTA
jgi:hypothetical protein